MKRLVEFCEQYLSDNLTAENATFALVLADQHTAPLLRHRSLMFVAANGPAVMATEGWRHLCASRPSLLQELFFAASAALPPGSAPLPPPRASLPAGL